jgi:hypothetical protein
MNYRRATLVGMMLLGGALVAVDLTASAVQMIAMHAESRRVAAWVAAEQELAAAPAPIRAANLVQVSSLQ